VKDKERKYFHTHYRSTRATTTSLENKIFFKGCLEAGEYIPYLEIDFIPAMKVEMVATSNMRRSVSKAELQFFLHIQKLQ